MVKQRADLLASNYLIRAEQRAEAVPEGKVMLSNTVVPTLPQYLIIKIKESRCSLGTKGRTKRWTALWARKSSFSVLPLTALCSQLIYNFWCARALHHTLDQREDATFEQFMLIFKLTVTPLIKDGSPVPLFYAPPSFFQPSFVRGTRPEKEWKKKGHVQARRFLLSHLGWKGKIKKTWIVSEFKGSVQIQIFILCVRIRKWTIFSSSALWKWKGSWKL